MANKSKIEKTQKRFLEAMKKKFSEDITEKPREADHGIPRIGPHPTLIPYRRN
jgi:hypothetical protein